MSVRSRNLGIVFALVAVLILALPSVAELGSITDLFQSGSYEEARQALGTGGEGARPGEEALWQARLSQSPDEALEYLESHRQDERLPEFVRQRMHLEMARLHFARQDYRAVLADLGPILQDEDSELPGQAYLLAGLTYRLLGDLQTAREMLASVRPSDPAFGQARYQLGDIGIQMGDPSLARRYFASADPAGENTDNPALMAGLWRAHRTAGEEKDARRILETLQQESPGSLPLMDINRAILQEAEDNLARTVTTDNPDETATAPVNNTGRYALQLGAFSDRALALEFVQRLLPSLPDLRIDQVRDDRGQFLYKVRTGSFVNPALARTEAAKLRRDLDIDVMVADLSKPGESGL